MLLLFIILVIVGAAATGLCVNYFSVNKSADKGSTVPQVLSGTGLIGAFLLAIVLSSASSSYSSAQKAAKQEADVIDTLYESANYVDMPFRQRIQAAAVCYARAVVGPEWTTLAKGKRSPVPNNWTGTKPTGIRAALLEMTPKAQGFSLIQSADAQRGGLRSERVTQANPSVPTPVLWFMVILIALSIGGVAYAIPREKNTSHLAAVGAVVLTFGVAMALIYNLDRPFSGVLALKSTAMQETADDDSADYIEDYGRLPCDDQGNPLTDEGVGGASTAPTTTTPAPTTATR
ncbi:MAG: hypothetical protein QOE93_1374 [Actinomycetota bacterium]|jgi:hypothetical protein|nr:hypothetical protein [Actinomycetota bacterium]